LYLARWIITSEHAAYLFFFFYRFETKITSLEVTGMSQEKCTPCLLSSRTVYSDKSTSLLSIMFETNPLDEKADQRLRIESQPLEIVYDAVSKY